MHKTRRQKKNKSGENANFVPASAEIESIPPQPIASTSGVSVQTDGEVGHWDHPGHPLHDLAIREGSSIRSGLIENNSVQIRGVGNVLKLARDIIPTFDGTNMSVNMFIEHCRAAAKSVDEADMYLLIMFIKNKVTGQARKHIQDKVGASLEEILKSLQRAFGSRADASQLAQELALITRKREESVADYGIRVSDILNRIIIKVMDKNPGARGLERCQEYKENAIKSSMRGLDRETLYFVKEKSPTTLDEAIELAAEADLENATWNSVHGVKIPSRDSNVEIGNFPRKRVATIQGNLEVENNVRKRSLSSIQCFNCQESGHFKRDCPKIRKINNIGKRHTAIKHCSYCGMDNHVDSECRLKQKYERERQNKRMRFMDKKDLNSKRGRQNEVTAPLSPNCPPLNES